MFNQRRFRPLGLADIFDEAFDLYKSNFKLFLAAASIVFVPLQVFMIAVVSPETDKIANMDPEQVITNFGATISRLLIDAPFEMAAYGVLSCGLIYIISQRYLDKPVTLLQSFKYSLPRILPLIVCVILTTLFTVIGTVCCLFPGLYISSRYISAPQIVLLEPAKSPFRAMSRSYKLTTNYFGRIAGCLILLSLISMVITGALEGTISLALNFIPFSVVPGLAYLDQNRQLTGEVADAITGILVSPYTFTLVTVLYYDMRIREEGFDMAILADQLGFSNDPSLTNQLPQAKPPKPPTVRKPFWRTNPKGAPSSKGSSPW